MPVTQCRRRIAFQQREAEHLKETGVNNISRLYYFFITRREQYLIIENHPDCTLHFRQFFFHRAGRRCGYGIPAGNFTIKRYAIPYFVYPVFVLMKLIVAKLVLYPQQNKYCSSHACCNDCNIDCRKPFITQKSPESD